MKLFEATFVGGATAASDDLYVRIPGRAADDTTFGPVLWHPVEGVYPAAKDEALVAESDTGRWWVLEWRPVGGFSGLEFTLMGNGDLYVSG